jgi:hypothetical protein
MFRTFLGQLSLIPGSAPIAQDNMAALVATTTSAAKALDDFMFPSFVLQ